jgi:hypothetical protein
MSKTNSGKAAPAAPAQPQAGAPAAPAPDGQGEAGANTTPGPTGQDRAPADSATAGAGQPGPDFDPDQGLPEDAVVVVTLRHKTEYPTYRRAGLVLTKQPKAYRVTPEQLEVLAADQWVQVVPNEVAAE